MKTLDADFFISDLNGCCGDIDSDVFEGKKVLVTGASGLIGTYLCAYFVSLKQRGVALDLYAVTRNELSAHLSDMFQLGNVKHLRINLNDVREYDKLPDVDYAIHAAGYAQPTVFMNNPADTLAVNVSATMAILKRISEGGHFVFLSSSEVYCGQTDGACDEGMCGTSTPAHLRACYIEGKRAGEAACFAYREKGVHASAARLGDIYGPGTRAGDKRALNSFIEQAVTRNLIKLRDQGAAMRSYCYVTDAVEMLLNMLMSGHEAIYNVGSPIFISIRDLAKTISELTDSELVVPEGDDSIKGAPKSLQMNYHRIVSEFGAIDYIPLRNGLERTILWQRGLYLKDSQ